MKRAPLRTRITDRLNVLIWLLPLPTRLRARLSGLVYRNPPMSERRARQTLEALAKAGVIACCMGGWGVDALVGEQSRVHRDLDLIVARGERETALEALAGLGYSPWYEQSGEEPLGERVVVRDGAMRVVDIHPVELAEADLDLAQGSIGGHPVTCLSARQQIRDQLAVRNRLRHERRNVRNNVETAQRALQSDMARPE